MARDHQPSRRRARVAATAFAAALTLGGATLTTLPAEAAGSTRGHDISSHQKNVDWRNARAKGARFVYVKATESTTYRNPWFARQYDGAREAGILHGAYHFAVPDQSSGTAQAAYFVHNGGAWRADGWTLPPALDIEYNPYGKRTCYGLDKAAMVNWIRAFSDETRRETGLRPVIYTTTHWWNTCTGSSRTFAADHTLWLARYGATDTGALPAGWSAWTFWQYGNSGSLPGDQNLFNGSAARLKQLALGR
ncbi:MULTISPECIES: lysozyme [unclassified Streptomyces]|jgi:lysozyme|uniref:lysozyme n=1 Tax=unclassified Streptomyces TaxID=2593676 RepID=UPI002E2720FE